MREMYVYFFRITLIARILAKFTSRCVCVGSQHLAHCKHALTIHNRWRGREQKWFGIAGVDGMNASASRDIEERDDEHNIAYCALCNDGM